MLRAVMWMLRAVMWMLRAEWPCGTLAGAPGKDPGGVELQQGGGLGSAHRKWGADRLGREGCHQAQLHNNRRDDRVR
eukprot:4151144-Pyramimonas_sp.AAC.2